MLELKNITKIFPGVKALDNVSLTFETGKIHGLIGENGAGKSTCMKIICGVYKADEGEVLIDGERVNFKNYQDAIEHEISIVNQEIQVVSKSTVAENVMLDKLHKFTVNGKINWGGMNLETQKYLDIVGLELTPTTIVEDLTAAQKQLIQIAKALSSNSKYLLLDEPTSSLTLHEAKNLFTVLTKLKEQGVSLIFITHKLEELLEMCDDIAVLRDGKYVGKRECNADLNKNDIIKMMIGRETKDKYLGKLNIDKKTDVLEINNLCQKGRFDNINFNLKKGEILGFYGLVGSGRTELAKVIIGEDKLSSGEIIKNGVKINPKSMAETLYDHKIGYVSENRKEEGLILDFNLKNNINITMWPKILCKYFRNIDLNRACQISYDMIDKLDIRTPGIFNKVEDLSGGNQQKVSLSKWLAANCDILIIDEPTVGVDVGAKEQIHQIIWDLAYKEGKSIILISSDLPEMVTLARRILVFKENEIVGELADLNDKQQGYDVVSERVGVFIA